MGREDFIRIPVFGPNTDLSKSFAMKHFTSAILLSAYGLVSLLGHAGFDVLGLHSHKHSAGNQVSAGWVVNEHHARQCEHSHGSHHDHEHAAEQSNNPFNDTQHEHESEDCTVCQFFGLLKTQIVAVSLPVITSVAVFHESFCADDVRISVNFKFLPNPRGPPSLSA